MSSEQRAIHQLVSTLSYGDAISGEALSLQKAFLNMGFSSNIYAINVHPNLKGKARDWRELEENFSGEIVLHYSLGSPLNNLYRGLGKATRTMIFHNLTDPKWYRGINPRVTADLEQGRDELPELCGITDRLIADSPYNAKELKVLGFTAEVLELPIDLAKWDIPANSGIVNLLQGEGGIHLLHVGRLVTNKCVEDIIKVFYFLHHKITRESRLWLVGIDIDTELYSFSLRRLVEELGLRESVNFVGCLADAELKAVYQNATAYLCMSEHEGFCLPVLEAMHFGLPVVAFSSSALPDTMGGGGVLVSKKYHPQLAELIYEISKNDQLRGKLVEAGHRRAKEREFPCFEEDVRKLWAC